MKALATYAGELIGVAAIALLVLCPIAFGVLIGVGGAAAMLLSLRD
jgi:hypothetical protein